MTTAGAILLLPGDPAYKTAEALPIIGILFREFSETITNLMNLVGFIMLVFGMGELTTHIKRKRHNKKRTTFLKT